MAVGDKVRSPIWGNIAYEITQEFGVPGADPSLYPGEYTEPLGWPAGYHIGTDYGVPKHTPLFAINPGKVILANPNQIDPHFRPKPVWIETEDNPNTIKNEEGYIEIYGHMWTNAVTTGQKVKPGTPLGTSGEQTYAGTMNPDGTGSHLHFELRKPLGNDKYKAVNPHSWVTEAQTEPSEEPGEETENGDTNTDSSELNSLIKEISQRSAFVIIGIILLAIGAYAVIRA